MSQRQWQTKRTGTGLLLAFLLVFGLHVPCLGGVLLSDSASNSLCCSHIHSEFSSDSSCCDSFVPENSSSHLTAQATIHPAGADSVLPPRRQVVLGTVLSSQPPPWMAPATAPLESRGPPIGLV